MNGPGAYVNLQTIPSHGALLNSLKNDKERQADSITDSFIVIAPELVISRKKSNKIWVSRVENVQFNRIVPIFYNFFSLSILHFLSVVSNATRRKHKKFDYI